MYVMCVGKYSFIRFFPQKKKIDMMAIVLGQKKKKTEKILCHQC